MAEALGYGYQKYIKDKVDAIEVDTIDLQTQIGVAGAGLSAIPDMALNSTVAKEATLSTVDGVVDSILIDTAEIGAAGAGLTAITGSMALNATVAKDATVAKTTELISGAAIDFGAVAKASLETAVDSGLDNVIAAPTAGSLAGIIKTGIPEIAPGSGDGLATHNDIIGLSGIRNTFFTDKGPGTPQNYAAISWVTIYTDSVLKDRKIKGIKITTAGTGTVTNPVYKIQIGGVDAFPYGASATTGNPVDTGVLKEFDEPVIVENGSTFTLQVYCDSLTLVPTATMTELDVIEFSG